MFSERAIAASSSASLIPEKSLWSAGALTALAAAGLRSAGCSAPCGVVVC
jgi:hypothetical protein